MPAAAELCARLGLTITGSDALSAAEIANPKQYRQHLHRAFLQRRPGQYSRKWLAQRLGVSVRSIQRYHQSSGISAKPVYHALPLAWHNLNYIPVGLPIEGMFIQTEAGKRYPPLPEIARQLLAKKERILLMRQDTNHYSVPPLVPDADRPRLSISEVAHLPEKAMLQHLRQLVAQPTTPASAHTERQSKERNESIKNTRKIDSSDKNTDAASTKDAFKDSIIIPQAPPKMVRRPALMPTQKIAYRCQPRRYYRQPLPNADHERTAQQLYSQLKVCCPDKKGYLTLAKARRLSEEFGTVLIQQALTMLNTRRNIYNPAGFVLAFLKSQHALR